MTFVPARHFHAGRITDVDLLVIHTAEGARTAAALGDYFRTTAREASAHSGVDERARVDYVRFDDTAWAAPGANADGEQLEVCGFAAWTRAEWLRHPGMLEQASRWLAERSRARSIPLTVLDAAELRADRRGVTTHSAVSAAFRRSTHTDPGSGFPLGDVVRRALVIRDGGTKPKPPSSTPTSKAVPPFPPGYPDGVMRQGFRGKGVLALQRRLRQRGWTIDVDGVFGPMTGAVVEAFQREKRLGADRIVGPKTWRALWAAPVT